MDIIITIVNFICGLGLAAIIASAVAYLASYYVRSEMLSFVRLVIWVTTYEMFIELYKDGLLFWGLGPVIAGYVFIGLWTWATGDLFMFQASLVSNCIMVSINYHVRAVKRTIAPAEA